MYTVQAFSTTSPPRKLCGEVTALLIHLQWLAGFESCHWFQNLSMFEYENNVLDLKSLEFLQFMLLHNAWGNFQSWIVKNVAREMKLKRDNSRYPCNWLRATRYKLSRSTGYRDQNQPVIKPSALSGDLNQRPMARRLFTECRWRIARIPIPSNGFLTPSDCSQFSPQVPSCS